MNSVEITGGEPVAGASNTVVARDGDTLSIKTTVGEGYRFDTYTAVGVAPIWEDGDPTKAGQTIEVQGKADISAHVVPIEYSVSVVGGKADVATAHVGDTVTITADAPEAGAAFVQWANVDGVDFGNASSVTTTFTMPAKDVTVTAVSAPIVIGAIEDKTYTGSPIEPADEVVVSLEGVDLALTPDDYEVSFEDNVDAGTATATVTMNAPRAGSATSTFEILPADIAESTAAIADQEYSGEALEPDPAVTWHGRELAKGADFTVSYENNVNAGTASFTITGKGNFTGTKSGTFKIVEPPIPPKTKGTLTFDLGGGTIDGKTSLVIEADVGYYPGDKYTVEGDHTFTAVWEKKSDGGNADTRGASSNASGKSSATRTGDGLGETIAMLGAMAVFALCLAFFALYRRRRPDEEKQL